MCRHHDRDPRRTECTDAVHHEHLIAEIEARRGLVHAEELRLLRNRTCQEDKLPLSAADLCIDLFCKMFDAEHLKCVVSNFAILFSGNTETADVGCPPHQHNITDCEWKRGRVCLRNIGDAACPLLDCPRGHILSG